VELLTNSQINMMPLSLLKLVLK